MTGNLKKGISLLRYNARAFSWFELLYKLLGVALFFPLLYGIFDLCMLLAGYRYLTLENVRYFFRNPLVYLFSALLLLLLVLYTFLDISAVIYIFHCSRLRKKTTAVMAMRFAVGNLADSWKKGERSVLRVVLLMIPVYNIGQVPELFSTYSVPNLFLLPIGYRKAIFAGMMGVFLLLMIPFVKRMYTFHFFSLEGQDGKQAVLESRKLGEGKRFRDFMVFLSFQAGCFLAFMFLLYLGIFLTIFFSRLFSGFQFLNQLYLPLVKTVIMVMIVVFSLLGVPVSVFCTSALFYRHQKDAGKELCSLEQLHERKNCRISEREKLYREKYKKRILFLEIMVFLGTVFACSFYVYRAHRGELKRNVEFLRGMEVTAHRGASRYYPENTMAAFMGAVSAGADWIELDIHESRDGQLFVMHDKDFRRTTGVRALAWELTYEEISEMDAGSFFSEEYSGEKIPLLLDVIRYAKETGVRLNIELKPDPAEKELEELLVELLHEEDFVSRCVVTSQEYEALKKIKELDENITTVYVMGFAYGNINRLAAADNFSIRYSSITEKLVSRVHNAGKQIYAWTVNGRDAINLMTERQVDNIITDNVLLARQCLDERITSDALNDYIQFLNREIRLFSYRFRMNS